MQQIDKEILQNFGRLIFELRNNKSASLNKFAFKNGGVTSATLSRIENGLVDFKFTTLIKLACILNISLKDLFDKFKYDYKIEE